MEWSCEKCTLRNSPSSSSCEACGSHAIEQGKFSSGRKRKMDEVENQNACSSSHKAKSGSSCGEKFAPDEDKDDDEVSFLYETPSTVSKSLKGKGGSSCGEKVAPDEDEEEDEVSFLYEFPSTASKSADETRLKSEQQKGKKPENNSFDDADVVVLSDSDDSEPPMMQPTRVLDVNDPVETVMRLTNSTRSASLAMLSSNGGDANSAIHSFFDAATAGSLASNIPAIENYCPNVSDRSAQRSDRDESKLKKDSDGPTTSIYISKPQEPLSLKCEDGAGCKGKRPKKREHEEMEGGGEAVDNKGPMQVADDELLYNPPPCSSADIPEEEEEEEVGAPLWQLGADLHARDDEDSDGEVSSRRSAEKEEQEEVDRFDDTDDDSDIDSSVSSPPEHADALVPEVKKTERNWTRGFNIDRCLPNSIGYEYVKGVYVMGKYQRKRIELPVSWPHPRDETYQNYLEDFFLGRVEGCAEHDWSAELARCTRVEKVREGKCLAPWQAAAYKHAQRMLSSQNVKGQLFWWTPGSGKSVMVALLIELLFTGPHEIFVVSTPQNTRENGYDECLRSLLQFSPLFAAHKQPPSADDFKHLATKMKKRKPIPLYKGNFMSLRKFQNTMQKRVAEGKSMENIAVIVDECHELSNARLCDQKSMWEGDTALLRRLAQGTNNKILLLSGTPWRDEREMLRLLNVVNGRNALSIQPPQSEAAALKMLEDVRTRARGVVSYVDGSRDRSTFPDNGGWRVERCGVGPEQLQNFAGRCRQQLQQLGVNNLCEAARLLSSPDEQRRREAVRALRLTQVASAVFWGSAGSGLCSMLQRPETATLTEVGKYAPKFAALARNVLWPSSSESAEGVCGRELDALQTRHFVYSGSDSCITNLSKTLSALRGEQRRFRQLYSEELEWTDASQTQVRLRHGVWTQEDEKSILFVVVRGSPSESKKLKAAFGFVTADARRYEGLQRQGGGGAPLVQMLLGSHETNQRIHLLEPNPLGWGKVLQTMGRGIRRGTHTSCPGGTDVTAAWFRRVETIIYAAVLAPSFLVNERAAQRQELAEKTEAVTADYAAKCAGLRQLRRKLRSAADASEVFVSKAQKTETKVRNAMQKLVEEHGKLLADQRKVEEGWLRVDVPGSCSKRTGKARRVLVQTWRMLPDEAVLHVVRLEQQARQRFDDAVRAAAVDATLLRSFHAPAHASHAPAPAAPGPAQAAQAAQAAPSSSSSSPQAADDLAVAFELAERQYLPTRQQELQEQRPGAGDAPAGAAAECLSCFQEASAGSVCSQGHFVCATCVRMGVCQAAAKRGAGPAECAQGTCVGFLSEQEQQIRKFPPYWSHQDLEQVHLIIEKREGMVDNVSALIQASVRPECQSGKSCGFSDVKKWGTIKKILRIENGPLWRNYCDRKVELAEAAQAQGETDHLPAMTEPWQAIFEDVALDPAVNEFFLFHGTNEESAKAIGSQGFKLEFANSGLYGAGVYAADSACKSASYCHGGTRVLLLCRVMMGPRPFRAKELHSGVKKAPAGFDSIFVEHGAVEVALHGLRQAHSEFVVFDNAQILPEYLVYVSSSGA